MRHVNIVTCAKVGFIVVVLRVVKVDLTDNQIASFGDAVKIVYIVYGHFLFPVVKVSANVRYGGIVIVVLIIAYNVINNALFKPCGNKITTMCNTSHKGGVCLILGIVNKDFSTRICHICASNSDNVIVVNIEGFCVDVDGRYLLHRSTVYTDNIDAGSA